MKPFTRLQSAQWLFRFCSPFIERTPLPPPDAWQEIFRIADRGLVLPRLAIRLTPEYHNVPEEVPQFLEACRELAFYRNTRLRVQLFRVCKELNGLGIVPVIIKGATTLFSDDAWQESRMMLDLDLWVPLAEQQKTAIRGLERLGYQMRGKYTLPEFHHYPPFFHNEEIASIELHGMLVHPEYARKINQADALASCTDHEHEGINYRMLSPQAALTLSYIQCCEADKTVGDQGAVMMMKWFDLLDKVHSSGLNDLTGPESLGITETVSAKDRQLLTSMQRLTALPYSGKPDETHLRQWENNFRLSDPAFIAWRFFGPIFDWPRWKGKSPIAICRSLIHRIGLIPSLVRRARYRM